MKLETYLGNLAEQLHLRGVAPERITEIISEVESHLVDSDENPLDAFGSAAVYAENMAASAEKEPKDQESPQWHHRTFRATAFDEMEILEWAGQEGWELVDVGALALFCRRPVGLDKANKWEYKRRVGTHHRIIREEMEDNLWEPCGNWIVFHYFKRMIKPLK